MQRRQLVELTDLSWWPERLRCLLTDYLQAFVAILRPFSSRVFLISEALRATGETRVIDLCSGGTGPWLHLADELRSDCGHDVEILLTDKYPDAHGPAKVAPHEGISFCVDSIDALSVPAELRGVRTIFNGFHHFSPNTAQVILEDAVKHRQAIVIFEFLHRSWGGVLYSLLAPITIWLLTPLIRPLTVSRLVFTYLIPIAPLALLWDAQVSNLRCYSVDELRELAERASRNQSGDYYTWQIGVYRRFGLPITYMLGYPQSDTSR